MDPSKNINLEKREDAGREEIRRGGGEDAREARGSCARVDPPPAALFS